MTTHVQTLEQLRVDFDMRSKGSLSIGLHWMVYSWIIGHPLGYRHAILRTIGLIAAWWAFPEHRVTACASIIVLAYAVTLIEMRARSPINNALATSPIGP